MSDTLKVCFLRTDEEQFEESRLRTITQDSLIDGTQGGKTPAVGGLAAVER